MLDISLQKSLINKKNLFLVNSILEMEIKDKRKIFAYIRKNFPSIQSSIDCKNINYIFPNYSGITLGEFCTSHVILQSVKKKL
jgi:hypothetical protein